MIVTMPIIKYVLFCNAFVSDDMEMVYWRLHSKDLEVLLHTCICLQQEGEVPSMSFIDESLNYAALNHRCIHQGTDIMREIPT